MIRYFCTPYYDEDGKTRFHSPADAPEKWEVFRAYNKRDVEVEMAIQERLRKYPVPETVWEEYRLDQEINDRGIRIDHDFVQNAIRLDEISHENLISEMKKLTGLENPNSVSQMKEYLEEKGLKVDSLGKKQVQTLIPEASERLREILELRLQSAKSSVKKYEAMRNAVCQTDAAEACSSSTVPIAPAAGLGGSFSCRTCTRTTWVLKCEELIRELPRFFLVAEIEVSSEQYCHPCCNAIR